MGYYMKRAAKKKGFTLVELVVVIAIIGVLTAILVPTIIGSVQDARIAAGNQIAKEVRDRAAEFMTMMDTKENAYVGGQQTLYIKAEDGWWEMTGGNGSADWLDGKDHWNTVGSVKAPDFVPNKGTEFLSYVADCLHDMYNGYAEIHIDGGKVVGAAVIQGADHALAAMPGHSDFRSGEFSYAGSAKAGLSGNVVIGTSPVLILPSGVSG